MAQVAKQGDINKTIEEVVKDPDRTILETSLDSCLFAGRYRRTEDPIGTGGMSDVFVAEDTQWKNRKVAIKIPRLPDDPAKSEACRKRFEREVETAMTLRGNTSIPQVYPGEHGDRPYMVMRYLENAVDLHRYVEDAGGRLSEFQIREVLKPIAEALDYAHAPDADHGVVVHRDVKPGNILVQKLSGGRLKSWIIDFGISKNADQKDGRLELTLSDFAGTLGYIAPEKLAGDRLPRPAQDIFSFAVVLYECLTGRHPFKDADGTLPTQVVLHQRMVAGEFKRIENATPLAQQVMRGLSADPTKRPKKCADFFAEPQTASPFELEKDVLEWNGREQRPAVRYMGKESLVEGRDYRVDYERNVAVGEAVAVVLGVSRKYHHLEVELPFKIAPRPISHVEVGLIPPQTYDGGRGAPKLKVSDAEIDYTLEEGRDYEAVPVGSCVAGTGTGKVRLIAKGGYTGVREEIFDVVPRRLDEGGFEIGLTESDSLTYDGRPKHPKINVVDESSGVVLNEVRDYVVSYDEARVAQCSYSVEGRGNYAGRLVREFFIEPRDISNVTLGNVIPVEYKGLPITHVKIDVSDALLNCRLTEGIDFDLVCENADKPGLAIVCVRGIGNYRGRKTCDFDILPGQFPQPKQEHLHLKFEYDGLPHGFDPKSFALPSGTHVTFGLSKDGEHRADLTVPRTVSKSPQMVWIRFERDGYVTKDLVGSIKVVPRSVRGLTPNPVSDFAYGEHDGDPEIVLIDPRTGDALKRGVDFEVSPPDFDGKGNGVVQVTGIGNYCDQRVVEFKIAKRDISSVTVDPIPPQVYDGQPKRPSLVVRYEEVKTFLGTGANRELRYGTSFARCKNFVLNPDVDYELVYRENTDPGEGTVQIVGKGRYRGARWASFEIVARNISSTEIILPEVVVFDGVQLKDVGLDIRVRDAQRCCWLTKDVDYAVRFEQAQLTGGAKVYVLGQGKYCGECVRNVEILKGRFSSAAVEGFVGEYDGKEHGVKIRQDLLPHGTQVLYSLKAQGHFSEKPPVFRDACKIREVFFRLFRAGFEDCQGAVTIEVQPRPLSKTSVREIPDQTFDGIPVRPCVRIADEMLDVLLDEGVDYSVEYRNVDNVGRGTVVVCGRGNYCGAVERNFEIHGKAVESISLTFHDFCCEYPPPRGSGLPKVDTEGFKIEKGIDYSVGYAGISSVPGWGRMSVRGRGKYAGTVSVRYMLPDSRFDLMASALEGTSTSLYYAVDSDCLVKLTSDLEGQGLVFPDRLGRIRIDLCGFNVRVAGLAPFRLTASCDDHGALAMRSAVASNEVKPTILEIFDSKHVGAIWLSSSALEVSASDKTVHRGARIVIDKTVRVIGGAAC